LYPRPTLTALRNQAITDIQTANLTNDGSALLPQSILRTLAVAEAGLTYELYAYLDYISLMAIPVTSTGEFLESWANLKGVFRLPATSSSGTCAFTGTAGVIVPAGSIIATNTNTQYATATDYVIGTSPPVTFVAVIPAAAGNAASGIPLSLSTPLVGVTSTTTAATPITGGADQETDSSLRSRMLTVYATPPDGGSANQIKIWCLQVPGVTRAWVNTIGVAAGAVEIFIMLDQTESAFGGFGQGTPGGATDEVRISPATGDMLTVANYLFPLRPVTSLYYVATPTAFPVNFSIQALQPTTAANEAAISAALSDMFVRLGSPLTGNAIYQSSSDAAIQSVPSVNTFTLLSPVSPIVCPVGSLPTLGVVTYS
jgi:uncharacterized phage protein gp47/JayE